MTQVIRVRDVVRGDIHELGPDQRMLRGSYDLFQPKGAVRAREGLIEWLEGGTVRTSRVAPAPLGEARPGERVLVSLPPHSEDEWWLCDVQAVDGLATSE
ncbi:MAG: hypothetical protein M3O50_10910 [Myxococcota bacterium]|nr:hypothetical protein [Myxococcota bacterium]